MIESFTLIALVTTAALASIPADRPASAEPQPAACAAASMKVRIERDRGRFDGMSHDGAVLVIQNAGESRCRIPAIPKLVLRDTSGSVVASGQIVGARFMHPGPVVVPIVLEAGDSAATTLRWTSNDVFPDGEKASAATIAVDIGDGPISAPLVATLWGEHANVTFEQNRLTTTLTALGPATPLGVGTYHGEGPAGSTEMVGSNFARTLLIQKASDGNFTFGISAFGGSEKSPNLGSLSGTLKVSGSEATFADGADDCRLTLESFGSEVTIAQSGTCGFGNGVHANGRYVLKASS